MSTTRRTALYHGDALTVLGELSTGRVQLVYVDPPWFTARKDFVEAGDESGLSVREYLQFIADVAIEGRRVLSDSGVLVFHADPMLSGNLRFILDQVFGGEHFRYEAILPRPLISHSSSPAVRHETLLYYSKSERFKFFPATRELSPNEIRARFPLEDHRGRFRLIDLTTPILRAHLQYSWRGIPAPPRRAWRYSRERLDALAEEGLIYQRDAQSLPRRKQYLADAPPVEVGSVWDDLPLRPSTAERSGFVAQQPVAVLERVLSTTSEPGDLIVDPFCGSGSMIVAADSFNREWVGGDISEEAVQITLQRLQSSINRFSTTGPEITKLERPAQHGASRNRTTAVFLGTGDEIPHSRAQNGTMAYDVFISHASEDKDDFVRPLAVALEERGFRVWYDEFTLSVGDSLAAKIDEGLGQSRFGVVILSDHFFRKEWPRRELNGFVAREIEGGKVILPIWHKVSKDEVRRYSATLADKVALNSSLFSIDELVSRLEEVLSAE